MHPNVEVARSAYAAFLSGDMEAMAGLMSDDIVWHAPGDNLLSGTYRGKEEVFGFFGKIAEMADGPMQMDIHDVLANDDHAVTLLTATVSRGGNTFDGRAVHITHVADGQITEFWNYQEDQAAADAFWS
jgi:ketosteroid isomerase-like protein